MGHEMGAYGVRHSSRWAWNTFLHRTLYICAVAVMEEEPLASRAISLLVGVMTERLQKLGNFCLLAHRDSHGLDSNFIPIPMRRCKYEYDRKLSQQWIDCIFISNATLIWWIRLPSGLLKARSYLDLSVKTRVTMVHP